MRYQVGRSLGRSVLGALTLILPISGAAQGIPARSGTTLFVLDLAGTPLGEIPTAIKQLKGIMEVVQKDGMPMLKASAASEFLITLPQVLPQDFTLEFDLVPKLGSNPQDLSFEGTPTINQDGGSAHVLWHATGYLAVIGGGGENYESPMPKTLRASLPGVLTHVVADFQGPTIKLYTNGERHYTLDKRFARGRVLRVCLGGQDDGTEAVYLAGLRISTGSGLGIIAATAGLPNRSQPAPVAPGAAGPVTPPPASTQSQAGSGGANRAVPNVAVAQGAGGPVVTWGLLGGVSSYTVKRWMLNNPTCCNNASPTLSGPPWQDTPLAVAGTYVYEVTASTPGWVATGQAQFIQFRTAGQIATVAPPPPPPPPPTAPIAGSNPVLRTGTTSTLAPPTNLVVRGTPAMATLTWQAPAGWTPTGYTVQRQTMGSTAATLLTTPALTATQFDDRSGFTAGQTYEYVVTALSGNPLASGVAHVQFSPPAPLNVTNLFAQQTGTDVTVSWAPVNGASTYVVAGAAALSRQVPGTQNVTTYSNLPAGTYTWSVGAQYDPGAIQTPAATWPSTTLEVLDPHPVLAEGKLYREVSRPEVFVLFDGKKIHIPTPDALRLMGYKWEDVTTVFDGALNGLQRFTFSGSVTPGSVLWPPTKAKAEYAPLRVIPGSTRVPTQGYYSTVGELRGWIRWSENMHCDEGDAKWGLEVDSEWAVRQGINLHDILWVGNARYNGGGITYPGSTERRTIATPIIQLEINSFTWPYARIYTDPNEKPEDWKFPRDDCNPVNWFPFDPGFPSFLSSIPDIAAASPTSPGVYVRVVGSLLTDNPHAWDPGHPWYLVARDWHPGVDPMTDVTHFARWVEMHPPDLVEPVTRDPSLPLAKLAAIGLVATPTGCEAAILNLAPDEPRPPGTVVGWEELRGPETFFPKGANAQNGSAVTDLGDHIMVAANVCGGGLGGSPGRFKAFYRVWWK